MNLEVGAFPVPQSTAEKPRKKTKRRKKRKRKEKEGDNMKVILDEIERQEEAARKEQSRQEKDLKMKVEAFFQLEKDRKVRRHERLREQYGVGREAEMLEQNLVGDGNYLFKRGENLRDGLIDIDRAFKVVKRIEEAIRENLGYELDEAQIATELTNLDAVILGEEDL